MKFQRPLIFLFYLLFPLWCAAVQPYALKTADPVLEPWRWRHETALSDLGVLCVDEAADGSLWFGCVGGLVHYDGMTVTKIPFDDRLPSVIFRQKQVPRASALMILPDGNLLVLIAESLVLRRDGEWQVIIRDVGASGFSSTLVQGPDTSVWLGVPSGVWRIKGDLTQAEQVLKSMTVWGLLSMCVDPAGNVWTIEKTGTLSSRLVQIPADFDAVNPRRMPVEFPVPFDNNGSEASILASEDGLIWYADGARNSGFETFDVKSKKWTSQGGEVPDVNYYSLFEREDGSIWAGASGRVLKFPKNGGSHTLYTFEQILLPKVPFDLFETRNHRLWMIGRVGHVYSVDLSDTEWVTYKDLKFDVETAEGIQWFCCSKNGFYQHVVRHDLRAGEWLQYTPEDGVPDRVLRIIQSSHGLIWAAGEHNGRAAFSVFDGEKWTRFTHPEFAAWIEPNSVFEMADGTVWLGAGGERLADQPKSGGALQYQVTDRGEVRLLKHHSPPDFPYYVTALQQTPDKTLWVGSTLLHSFDGTSRRTVPILELQGENTPAMTEDNKGGLWVLKEQFGVYRKTGDVWQVFTTKNGLSGLMFSSIVCLEDGSILVSSSEGLDRFDGQVWTKVPDSDCFGMATRMSSLRKTEDGSIWMNYDSNERRSLRMRVNNLIGVCAVRYRPEKNPPETRIDDWLERVAQPGNTHISWSGNDQWNNTPSANLQYSWRLNGGEWSAFSTDGSKTFLNLENGDHVFEVRARDVAFNVDPTPARVGFKVIPPVWMQLWFISLIFGFVALIGFLILLLIVTRERHLKERQADREALLIGQQEQREKTLIEQQAAREAHLEEIDRIKTGFFINISHELRTPMTVVAGRLETMFNTEPDEKRKNSLSIVLRNAQRVSTLITQLLDFRKIEEGKLKVEATQGDLVPLLKEWVASLQVLAEQARISFSLDSVMEFRGWFDFDKLQKICTNLMSNSIKYTKSGGAIRVLLKENVEEDGRRELIFSVEDTGLGISREHLPRIFDRFYRVSEASMAEGAGIGLNLTKELIGLLGGTIQVESPIHPDAEGPGTRFTVRLPVEQGSGVRGQETGARDQDFAVSNPSDLPDPSGSADSTDRMNQPSDSAEEAPLILVVEDDADIRSFIVEGLDPVYRVLTAKNGEIGLRMAKEQVPDLIITDVMMPVMDGMTLCRELKTGMETSHIPVIMLTAKTAVESQIEGLKTGADDYITKPFHMALLRVRVANLLESRRILREQFLREYSVLAPTIPENTPDKEFLEKVVKVMEAHYSDWTFGPDQLSTALNMSRSTLQRKLKAATNRTRSELISEFRMMKAAELLVGTTKTVAEVSFDVGCDEPANFSRLFKKHHGKTPSQYRDEYQSSA